MALLLFVVVSLCFLNSLLPFMYPGTLIAMFGGFVNATMGEVLARNLNVGVGPLVMPARGTYVLTFEGVLALYLPLLGILFLAQRTR